jgi:asparagine synthase (glutamine-hydrolysing)
MFTSFASETDRNRKIAALADPRSGLIHPYFLARALFTGDQRNTLLLETDDPASARAMAPLIESLRHARALDPVNRVSYLESRCYMLNTLLRDADVMSMAHGLELRVPLIDHELADKLLAMPGLWKTDANTPKPAGRGFGRSSAGGNSAS